MIDLLDLQTRLSAADGPNRILDCAIGVALDCFEEALPAYEGGPARYGYRDGDSFCLPGGGYAGDMLVPAYTGSIDAAVRLIGAVLPTWGWRVSKAGADFWSPDGGPLTANWCVPGYGATPAIALCVALLKAKAIASK